MLKTFNQHCEGMWGPPEFYPVYRADINMWLLRVVSHGVLPGEEHNTKNMKFVYIDIENVESEYVSFILEAPTDWRVLEACHCPTHQMDEYMRYVDLGGFDVLGLLICEEESGGNRKVT